MATRPAAAGGNGGGRTQSARLQKFNGEREVSGPQRRPIIARKLSTASRMVSHTTKVRRASKPAANDSPMAPKKPTVHDVECGSVAKAGRELPGKFTLKLLTDDRGQPDAICMIAKRPVA